ncbi:FtsX-like permease family protein [Streptomyces sp. NPDC020412]|uniref:FtsX-like permease family protein n=1 Tax=Streptomyces sp. NPDC020412 TaxID=3365073 RepID=UPI003789AA9E
MTGFVFHRARGHRLLLAAALLAVLLTTTVLTALVAFAGAVEDAGLRHSLRTRNAADAALVVTADNATGDRAAMERSVRRGAERAFDGLPVALEGFERSAPYALPRELQQPAARSDKPDLTMLAAVERTRVRLVAGGWPSPGGTAGGVIEVALPEAAAKRLALAPGPRVLTLASRLSGPPLQVRITGTYRPLDREAPYWRLDELGGRGVRTEMFTTYGPLLADPGVLASGRVAPGPRAWLATADFTTLRTDDVDALRSAAEQSQERVGAEPGLATGVVAKTALPQALGQLERALLVSRATVWIVSLQLVLLAGYALLLVARLLHTDRAAESRILAARGASRGKLVRLSALEALVLALPAAACAPLLAGPLTAFLADRGATGRIGLRLDTAPTLSTWLTGLAVALACAAAVVAPVVAGGVRRPRGRARALLGPLRAGADLALLAVAGVAYWQLERRSSGSGALTGDRAGQLGVDPLLVVAPALALLAGTVLTLRLLPLAAKLAERRAARGRGLTASLVGWQLSRRPMRGAGPVLLLVLAVAMGVLAIGQGASWDRSQQDQADFRAGAPVRVLGGAAEPFGRGGAYEQVPGVSAAVPAARKTFGITGGRQATALALDARLAAPGLLVRDDLADGDPRRLVASLAPRDEARAGVTLPDGTERLVLDLALSAADDGPTGTAGLAEANGGDGGLFATATVEDRFGVPYRIPLGDVPVDGEPHPVTVDFGKAAEAPAGRPAGPLALTALEVDEPGAPDRVAAKRLTVKAMRAVVAGGDERPVTVPAGLTWQARAALNASAPAPGDTLPAVTSVGSTSAGPIDVAYHTGTAEHEAWGVPRTVTLRIVAKRPPAPVPTALATRTFLDASAAKVGSVVQVPMQGGDVKVRITGVLRAVPTTAPAGATDAAAGDAGARPPADGGALLLDLRAVNRVLAERPGAALPPAEWWLFTEPGAAAQVAAALRDRAEVDPAMVQSRDEVVAALDDDPVGAGPRSALPAVAVAAALLAAVGFAVATAGALRERTVEFAVLRGLGAPRRQLTRLLAVEQSVLIGAGLVMGVALGAVLTRAVVPLIVLTGQAARPVPDILVQLPPGQVALVVAGVAAVPLAIVAALALRRDKTTGAALRGRGGDGGA